MKKIKITTDSTADFTPQMLQKLDISTIPLTVILGDKEYQDGVDINPQMIFDHVAKTGGLPKTAATNPAEYTEFFSRFLDGDTEIIHFSLSSCISLVNTNAKASAASLPGVYIIDSKSLSTGTALLAMYAKDLAAEGKLTAEEIVKKCEERIPYVQTSFIVDTLEYLYKGGRCSSLAMLGSMILKIKPIILLTDGAMKSDKKFMGNLRGNAVKYVDYILGKFNNPDYKRVFITHSYADKEIIDTVRAHLVANYKFQEIIETVAGSTITSHCGRNTFGILYINDGGAK